MRMALRLAAQAAGRTHPNTMVGALVVRSGRIVGRGFHRRAGAPHAEVQALRQAGRFSRNAALYVTLEPCKHFGRTPPCTHAIVKSGIRRVVAAMIDPNPKMKGRSFRWLRSQGIRTSVGILKEESMRLNKAFVTRVTKKRPFVTVKVAQSLDGKIATKTGQSQWISSPEARRWTHHLRSQVDAILVGVETILKDDPRLTVRLGVRKQPMKVVLDSRLRTPPKARIFNSHAPVLIATTKTAPRKREEMLCQVGAHVLRLPSRDGRVDLKGLLRELARREVTHLLVEGGGQVIASAFATRAVDRVAFIVAPLVIGGKEAPTAVEGSGIRCLQKAFRLKNITCERLGPDLLVTADV